VVPDNVIFYARLCSGSKLWAKNWGIALYARIDQKMITVQLY